MELEMKMKEKHGGAYAPFEVELKHLFDNNGQDTLFRKTQRIFLILYVLGIFFSHSIRAIMEGDPDRGGAGQNMDKLVQNKIVTRYVVTLLVMTFSKNLSSSRTSKIESLLNHMGQS